MEKTKNKIEDFMSVIFFCSKLFADFLAVTKETKFREKS